MYSLGITYNYICLKKITTSVGQNTSTVQKGFNALYKNYVKPVLMLERKLTKENNTVNNLKKRPENSNVAPTL